MTVHDDVGRTAGRKRRDREEPEASPAGAGPGSGSTAVLVGGGGGRRADKLFKGLTMAAAGAIIVVVLLIAVELLRQAVPAIAADEVGFLTSSQWNTTDGEHLAFGVLDLLKVTILSSVFALLLAVPVAVGIATFLVQYAPRSLSRVLGVVIDLLAAVPSIIFGLWGIRELAPRVVPVARFLNHTLGGGIFLFGDGNVSIGGGGTIFTAGIVLAIMILPIITSITRETLRQTPALHQEAALALGATKWEKIRITCFPYAKSGIVAGAMLALGRALGETVAVLIILRGSQTPSSFSLFDGGFTFASKIASGSSEFTSPLPTGAYIAAGLVLFVLTFVVNAVARAVAGGKVNG